MTSIYIIAKINIHFDLFFSGNLPMYLSLISYINMTFHLLISRPTWRYVHLVHMENCGSVTGLRKTYSSAVTLRLNLHHNSSDQRLFFLGFLLTAEQHKLKAGNIEPLEGTATGCA